MPALTNRRNDLEQAIAQGIDFLHATQLPSGTFRIFCSPHPLLEEDCKPDHSTFQTAQISYCLDFTKSERAGEIVSKAIRFLLGEMQDGGVWRYTCSPNPNYLPPDVDDTACISFLLKQHGISLPDNMGVMLGNRAFRGLFYTWILPRPTWTTDASFWRVALRQIPKLQQLYWFFRANECRPNDLDPVVNANVLRYLGDRPETRPIIRTLIRIIEDQAEETCDKYYGSRFTFYYFLSRNHAAGIPGFGPVGDTIIERIKSYAHPNGVVGSHILHTALAACALMDWKDHSTVLDDAIQAILRAREPSGGWRTLPFYYSGQSKKLAWGSEEITTGFCLEALSRYRKMQS
ncbi:MAG TPA: hypothetical protein VN176_15955 [Verrucomicrobiae bacterium]|jgi:hypothetical protein|nr:hypothetical protein [Verrucomicrobiae bacterium]